MTDEIAITTYYGPLSWYIDQLSKVEHKSLLDVVYKLDDEDREHLLIPAQPDNDGTVKRPEIERAAIQRIEHLAAESGDFANLNDHIITNFPGLVRRVNPKHLHLHNPPLHVYRSLEHSFPDTLKTESFTYPPVLRNILIEFQERFSKRVIGQEEAKLALLTAMYSLTRRDRDKPVVLMFYGPSGVGKTESAHFINSLLKGTLMRKQFSMFHSEQFASYVFGGKHSEPSFAHDLLDREPGVILIDEFDKASPVFHSAFYQLFDSGVFEDKNYRAEIKGANLIICTSNYGTEEEIRRTLGDALYSRFDQLIQFKPLTKDEIHEVIDRLVDCCYDKLEEDEKSWISAEDVKAKFKESSHKLRNVRKLGKLVDEVISLALVRAMLNKESPISEVNEIKDPT